jgi:hypothetical protein
MLTKMREIEHKQARDTYPWQRLYHNDSSCVDVLGDDNIRFIEWEFSGVGDNFFSGVGVRAAGNPCKNFDSVLVKSKLAITIQHASSYSAC